MYKAKFLDEFLENSDFKDWIQRRQKDLTKPNDHL